MTLPMPSSRADSPLDAHDEELHAEADDVLRALAGSHATLRPDQWQAIEALVVQRRRTLVVQRTGWGKSAVYFVATALLRRRGAGPTLIVSPLLALMRNQVEAAERAGIRACTINSSNPEDWPEVERRVHAGEVDVLLVSPERLNAVGFREAVLPSLAATAGLVVVDEAHCISDWGHDFRPDYRRLRDVLARLPVDVAVLATTATANARVTADVAEQLSVGGPHESTLVLRGALDRESLALGVLELPTSEHRLAWLAENLESLPGSGIIYALTVSQADDLATFLRERGSQVLSYTGRTDATERADAEQALLGNRVKALVATSALGMGFDKPDLGFVVHVGSPSSPISYYQQVGRAGRALDSAVALLLPGPEDERIWTWFASVSFPPEQVVRDVLRTLGAAGAAGSSGGSRPVSTAALEPRVQLNRSRLEQLLKVLDVDGVVRRVAGGWVPTGVEWVHDGQRYARLAEARAREQEAMRAYVRTPSCRMAFLRAQLDDPEPHPCGRCDRCAAPFYATSVAAATVSSARSQARRPGVELAPRVMWPTGLRTVGVPLSGRIPAAEAVLPGRAVGRLSDLGWGGRLRETLDAGLIGASLPDELQAPVVEVLRTWQWERRPAAVLWIASRSRPQLARSLAERIATLGRLPVLGPVERRDDGDGTSRVNSAQRVRRLHDAFALPDAVARSLGNGLAGAPILLVDDLVVTGWTMALAGRCLRAAGAGPVLPFALAVEG